MHLVVDFLAFIYLSGLAFYAPRVFYAACTTMRNNPEGLYAHEVVLACIVLSIYWPGWIYMEWEMKNE